MEHNQLVIIAGEHRNEKSAYVLAHLVTGCLRSRGYSVILEENPETRTLMEMVLDCYTQGKRLKKAEITKWLYLDEDFFDKYLPLPVFNFHNQEVNFMDSYHDEEDWKHSFNSFTSAFPTLQKIDPLKSNPLAAKVNFLNEGSSNSFLLEIYAYFHPTIPEEYKAQLRKVLHSKTKEHCGWYLHDVDLNATRKAGLLSEEMVQVLATGIEYLVKNGYKDEWYE